LTHCLISLLVFCLSCFQNTLRQYLRKCFLHCGDLVNLLCLAIVLFFPAWLVCLACYQKRYVLGCSSIDIAVCCLLFFLLYLFYNLYVFFSFYSSVLNSAFFVPRHVGNSLLPKLLPYAVHI